MNVAAAEKKLSGVCLSNQTFAIELVIFDWTGRGLKKVENDKIKNNYKSLARKKMNCDSAI